MIACRGVCCLLVTDKLPACALQESRKRELSVFANFCIGFSASALFPLAPVIVFVTAILTAIFRALFNVFCSCCGSAKPASNDMGTRALATGVARGAQPARRIGAVADPVLQEPLIVIN